MSDSVARAAPGAPPTPPAWIVTIVGVLDRISLWSGRLVSWLIIPMILSLVYEVVARYVFNAPTVWAYDMTYMLYGSFFMLGAAYTLLKQSHIRTDFFYSQWSTRRQGLIDSICYIVFFFPAIIALFWASSDFFWASFMRGERVVTSPWMPVVYPLKFAMPATCVLLMLQGIAEFIRSVWAFRAGVWLPRIGGEPVTAKEAV